jgi:hypothetical protein
MKLASRDGGYAGLRVVAYEFETPPAIAADEDDADEWLVVRETARLVAVLREGSRLPRIPGTGRDRLLHLG